MNEAETFAATDRPAETLREGSAEPTGAGDRYSPPGRLACVRSLVLKACASTLCHLLTRPVVRGAEHVPPSGPCVLVINHVSNFDPPIIFALIARPDMTALVASEYQANPVYRRAIEWAGGSWIRRGASDRQALRYAIGALNDGRMVGIAPEGGRSKNGQLREGKPGPAFLAIHTRAPILPVGLTGTGQIAAGLKRLRRVPVTVTFGPEFNLPTGSDTTGKQHLQHCTTEIMCRIAVLLPPEARGAYADAPRLRELLTPHEIDPETGAWKGVSDVPSGPN